MAGRIVRVCAPKDFDFEDLDNLGMQEVVVGERIDCSQYDQVDVMVRLHGTTTIPSNGTIEVVLLSDGFTQDDPSQDFFEEIGSVTLTYTMVSNGVNYTVATETQWLGSMLAVKVRGTQPSPAAAMNARLSIDLGLKTC